MTETKDFSSVLDESKNMINDIKKKNVKDITATPRNILFGVLVFAGMLFVGAMALQIITGVIALICMVLAGVGLFLGLRFLKAADPLIKKYTQNLILSKMIENAKTYKMETLTNRVIDSYNMLNEKRAKRDSLRGFMSKLKIKLDESDKNASTYQKKLDMFKSVERGYSIVTQNVDKAGTVHKALETKVNEYKDMDEFTGIITDAMSLITDNGGQKLDEMLSLEAFSEIENEFHTAMAQIDNSVRDFENDNA